MRTELMSAISLAYIGDAVLEIYAREHVILELKVVKPNLLQKYTIEYVSARNQAMFIDHALEINLFTKEEMQYYYRGKNARDTRILKNASPQAHRKSTGFEAILGYLHLNQQTKRIEAIFETYKTYIDENSDTIMK